jgi:hypothetical protein
MPGTDRVFAVVLVLVASLAQGCGHLAAPSAAGCSSDEQCSADARCTAHACIANQPPVADFAVSGDLSASSVVTLDGSSSHDPDAGDAIASYSWSITADGAPCTAPAVAGAARTAQVRFACAGRYQVRLSVFDAKGAEGSPVSRAVDILPRRGGALVSAGPDQAVDHACAGSPLRCTTATAVQLTAAVAAGSAVAFRWSVQPSAGRLLDAHRRVEFSPDESAQSPTVVIETDGTAISGDWVFRVEVLDAVGVVDEDETRVSVGNRPPVVKGGPAGPFDHAYVAEGQVFVAAGSFPVEAEDPDGDPVTRQVTFHHTGDGGAAFQGEDLGAAVRFSAVVPRQAPSDALFVAGAAGLDRSVEVAATDVNGGAATTTYSVAIGDRPPMLLRSAFRTSPHWYDAASRRYLADADLGQFADPDGDPLDFAVTADAECGSFAVDSLGTVLLRCARAFAGTASLPGFLAVRGATVTASDPWGTFSTYSSFRISNRSPVAPTTRFTPQVACQPWAVPLLCPTLGTYRTDGNLFPAATVYAPSGASDPDGDPLDVLPTANGVAGACPTGLDCKITVLLPEARSCSSEPPDLNVPFTASDGVASVAGSVLVDPRCP